MSTISGTDSTHDFQCFDTPGYNAFKYTHVGSSGKK